MAFFARIESKPWIDSSPRNGGPGTTHCGYCVVFSHELQKYSYSEGRNLLVIDGFDTQVDRAEQIAKTIVAQRPDAIVTAVAFTKLLQGAKDIILLLTVLDGLLAEHAVDSLAHPGGNTTRISILASGLDETRQEILLEAVPSAHSLAIVVGFTVTPAVYAARDYIGSGGLISYRASIFYFWCGVVSYIDRISKGASPADLPVQQPTRFALVINRKTAKAFGLSIPQSLLARADEVIE